MVIFKRGAIFLCCIRCDPVPPQTSVQRLAHTRNVTTCCCTQAGSAAGGTVSSLNIQYIVACFSLSSSQYMRAFFVPLYYVLCEVSRLAQLNAEHAILSLVISKLKDCFVFFFLFSIFLHKPCLERKLTAGNLINTWREFFFSLSKKIFSHVCV